MSATACCGSPAISAGSRSTLESAVQHHPRARIRVGSRAAAPGAGQDVQGSRRSRGHPGPDARVRRQGRAAGGQGLRRLPGGDVAVAGGHLPVHPDGQRDGQRHPQRVVQRGDLLRALPRWRREIHQDRHGGRVQGPVVSAPDAGQRQLRRRPHPGLHERQPVLPDRAPPLSGPAEQSAARDRGAGACGLRQVRPALHHRLIPAAVRQDVADHRQALAAEQVSARHRRRRPGNPQRADVHPTRARIRPHRPGDRPSPRVEDSDLDGAAVGAVTVPPSGPPSRLRHRSAPASSRRAAATRPAAGPVDHPGRR